MTTEAEYAERRARLLGPMNGLSDSELKLAVREACARLATTLDSFCDRQATWKPDAEEWSAAQVGDHIALGTGVLGKIAGLLANGQAVTAEDWDPPPLPASAMPIIDRRKPRTQVRTLVGSRRGRRSPSHSRQRPAISSAAPDASSVAAVSVCQASTSISTFNSTDRRGVRPVS